MGKSYQKAVGTSTTGAIAVSATVPTGIQQRLVSVTCNYNIAPTTSQNFTVTLDANAGSTYDTLLYSVNPSLGSTTDILWTPDLPLLLETGDIVTAAYTNTDARTYGVQITLQKA